MEKYSNYASLLWRRSTQGFILPWEMPVFLKRHLPMEQSFFHVLHEFYLQAHACERTILTFSHPFNSCLLSHICTLLCTTWTTVFGWLEAFVLSAARSKVIITTKNKSSKNELIIYILQPFVRPIKLTFGQSLAKFCIHLQRATCWQICQTI